MNRATIVRAHVICGVALALVSQGCSQSTIYTSSTRVRQETWRANLDECRQVRLSCDLVRDRLTGEPDRKYEQLRLEVAPREHLSFRRTLKKIELKFGVPRGQLRFQDVEVRADQERRRVWFVDGDTKRIIATLDRETGATTGPDDDPPDWATPDGGAPLEEAE
jgi:hypothetical protein